MKNVKMLFLVFFLVGSFASFAKQVPTEGKWWRKYKSIDISSPLEICLREEEKIVSIYFYADLGRVDITLYNSIGDIVYSKNVEAVAFGSHEFSLEYLPVESYTISVSNGLNEIKGVFFIY